MMSKRLNEFNEREYCRRVKLPDRPIDEVGGKEDHPPASLMDVPGAVVEKYEDEHVVELA